MSTMEISSGAAKSTLNPNAPLFIPAALQQVEDFSPEWWELVKTTSWFRDHWFCQYQEQETFNGHQEEGGVAKLLPDSFELGTANDFSQFDTEFEEEAALFEAAQIENELAFTALKKEKEKVKSDSEMNAKELDLGNSTESSGEACGESSQKVLG